MVNTEIDFNKKKFKKVNGEEIPDVIGYIKEQVKGKQGMRIMVGCDSKQRRRITMYSIVIVLYDVELHKGAHIISMKVRTPKERVLFSRMMTEAVFSLNLSLWLDEKLEDFYMAPAFDPNDYDKSIPTRNVEIHVDVNPYKGDNDENKSNVAYKAIMGMLCSSGFSVKSKPSAYAASCAADYLVQ